MSTTVYPSVQEQLEDKVRRLNRTVSDLTYEKRQLEIDNRVLQSIIQELSTEVTPLRKQRLSLAMSLLVVFVFLVCVGSK